VSIFNLFNMSGGLAALVNSTYGVSIPGISQSGDGVEIAPSSGFNANGASGNETLASESAQSTNSFNWAASALAAMGLGRFFAFVSDDVQLNESENPDLQMARD
jgi:hypothetical protein